MLVRPVRGDQGTYRHQTPLTGSEVGTQPQIAEQDVRRVLHDAGRYGTELLADKSGAARLCGFVERQRRRLDSRQLIAADLTRGEYVLCYGHGRHGIRRASIESEMRYDLGDLFGRDAAVERAVEIEAQPDRLSAGDEGRERYNAAIARGQIRPFPDVAMHSVSCIYFKSRRNLAQVRHHSCILSLGS